MITNLHFRNRQFDFQTNRKYYHHISNSSLWLKTYNFNDDFSSDNNP